MIAPGSRAMRATGLMFACGLGFPMQPVLAQDGFGNAPVQQPPPQAQGQPPNDPPQDPYGQPMPYGSDPQQRPVVDGGTMGKTAGETQDFGVPPQAQLRPTQQLHGPTPGSIPGGKVITTQALARLLQDRQSGILLFHVLGSLEHLPGAIPVAPAGQGGGFDDQVQREFGQYLQQATAGSKTRPMVFYCSGVQCWMSYNAALRAMKMGYGNVIWYRGGLEAWQQAGLPVQTAPPTNGAQGQPQMQGRP